MKTLLIPLLTLALLSACSAPVVPSAPDSQIASVAKCAQDCENFHGGYVRGCRVNVFGGQNRARWETCVDEANRQLGECYRACESGQAGDRADAAPAD